MDYYLQISTGGYHYDTADFESIRGRIEYCMERVRVGAILIGWAINPGLYKKVCEHVAGRCPVYLWLPAFAEAEDLFESEPTVGLFGNPARARVVSPGEKFLFSCPSSSQNRSRLLEVYDKYFADCGFDGVFLDKIRYATFINGYEEAFGCFCARCRDIYREEGVRVETLSALIGTGYADFLAPYAFSHARVHFSDENVQALYTSRAKIITASVARLTEAFRSRGLKVGLDTYAPAIAWFAGQDILELSRRANFLKPMMYRRSSGPASIAYEFAKMLECMKRPDAFLTQTLRVLKTDDHLGDPFYLEQLRALDGAGCPVVPGVEVNRKPGCDSTPAYVAGTAELARSQGCGALVLSWNILMAPDENIDCLTEI